jgi:hypothetical protein
VGARGTDSPNTFIAALAGSALGTVSGTDGFRIYVPSLPYSKGIRVRDVRAFVGSKTGTAGTSTFDVQNRTTTMISGTFASTANQTAPFTTTATVVGNGTEIVKPGDWISIDWTDSGQTLLTGYRNVVIQIGYDNL